MTKFELGGQGEGEKLQELRETGLFKGKFFDFIDSAIESSVDFSNLMDDILLAHENLQGIPEDKHDELLYTIHSDIKRILVDEKTKEKIRKEVDEKLSELASQNNETIREKVLSDKRVFGDFFKEVIKPTATRARLQNFLKRLQVLRHLPAKLYNTGYIEFSDEIRKIIDDAGGFPVKYIFEEGEFLEEGVFDDAAAVLSEIDNAVHDIEQHVSHERVVGNLQEGLEQIPEVSDEVKEVVHDVQYASPEVIITELKQVARKLRVQKILEALSVDPQATAVQLELNSLKLGSDERNSGITDEDHLQTHSALREAVIRTYGIESDVTRNLLHQLGYSPDELGEPAAPAIIQEENSSELEQTPETGAQLQDFAAGISSVAVALDREELQEKRSKKKERKARRNEESALVFSDEDLPVTLGDAVASLQLDEKGSVVYEPRRNKDNFHRTGFVFEKMSEYSFLEASRIPSVGGLMDISISVIGGVATIQPCVSDIKNQRVPVGFEYKGSGTNRFSVSLPDGEFTIKLQVAEKKRESEHRLHVVVLDIVSPKEKFYLKYDFVRPIAYYAQTKLYRLPDGKYIELSKNNRLEIDEQTGCLSDGSLPVIQIMREPNLESSRYEGVLANTTELENRLRLDRVLSQYHVDFVGSFEKNLFQGANEVTIPRVHRQRIAREIKEKTAKKPLDIVVSVRETRLYYGLMNLKRALLDASKKSDGQDKNRTEEVTLLITTIDSLLEGTDKANVGVNLSSKERHEAYVSFMRSIQSEWVSEFLNIPDVRQRFFSSDIDGETAIALLQYAGIRTSVIPFSHNESKFNGATEYIPRAWHIDINHTTSGLSDIHDADGSQRIATFLDEDGYKNLSATSAVYEHLTYLGFLEKGYEKDVNFIRYVKRFVSEEDSFTGPYATQRGCANVFNNYPYSIYGVSKKLLDVGRFSDVLTFLRRAIERFEDEEMETDPSLRSQTPEKKAELTKRVLRRLVTFDTQAYFIKELPEDVDFSGIVSKLIAEREKSNTYITRSQEVGLFGTTRFGKTLFDVFNAVPQRGLAAFAKGYDCYVGYNAQNKTCIINIAPFASNTYKIPDNLLMDEQGGSVGTVVKQGRFLVMNSKSKTLRDFQQLTDVLFVDSSGNRLEIPEVIKNIAEQQGFAVQLQKYLQEGVKLPNAINRYNNEAEGIREMVNELYLGLSSGRTHEELVGLRKKIGYKYHELERYPGNSLYQISQLGLEIERFIKEDVTRVYLSTVKPLSTRAVRERVSDSDMERVFSEVFWYLVADDHGLKSYSNILSSQDLNEIKNVWIQSLKQEWGLPVEKK